MGKGAFIARGVITLLVTVGAARSAEPPNDTAASTLARVVLDQLIQDVKALRAEVIQLRLEAEQSRIERLERDLRNTETDLLGLATEEQELRQEVDDVQRRSSDPEFSSEQRTEITTNADEALTTGLRRIYSDRARLEHKLADIRPQLAAAYQKRAQVSESARGNHERPQPPK